MRGQALVTFARRIAGRVLAALPKCVLGRILPKGYRFRAVDVVRPAPLAGGRRLIVAPQNYAGQAFEWCRAVERANEGTAAQNFMIRMPQDFRHAADYAVPVGAYAASGSWHRAWSAHVLGNATHVIVEGQKQPLGNILIDSTVTQVRRLQEAGIAVAMICHGSDVRVPSRHARAHVDSPFSAPGHVATARLERATRANLAVLKELALPTFVSTPDLLIDVPDARWLPVVVNPSRWAADRAPFERDVPIVVHAPSSGWIKGSELVDPIMSRLHGEGLIEYRRLSGIPHAAMADAYTTADIVLEQFRIGNYGVAACEAMAAGRLVIGYISDQVHSAVREQTGLELPIVRASHRELEGRIRALVADREFSRDIAASGPAFIKQVHDGAMSAKVLQDFLDNGS